MIGYPPCIAMMIPYFARGLRSFRFENAAACGKVGGTTFLLEPAESRNLLKIDVSLAYRSLSTRSIRIHCSVIARAPYLRATQGVGSNASPKRGNLHPNVSKVIAAIGIRTHHSTHLVHYSHKSRYPWRERTCVKWLNGIEVNQASNSVRHRFRKPGWKVGCPVPMSG